MKKTMLRRLLSFVLAAVMLLPLISLPTFAEEETVTLGAHDFEALTVGDAYTATNTSLAPAYSEIVQVGDTKALRLPIVCTDASSPRTAPTNRGRLFQMKHDALPAAHDLSVKVDVYLHGAVGTTPNVGFWLRKVGYTNASGVAATAEYYRLVDIDLISGEALFTQLTGQKKDGAEALKQGQWNTVEILFHSADGTFDIYFNDALYAEGVRSPNVTGTNFTVAADQLMYAVDSNTTNNNAFTAASAAGTSFANASYMDADNFSLTAIPVSETPDGGEDDGEEEDDNTVTETPMEAAKYGGLDLYGFETGKTLTGADGFSAVAPINQVAVRDGRRVLRLPMACTDTANLKTAPTNHGQYFRIPHKALPTDEKTSIKVDLFLHGIKGTTPNIGFWIQSLGYTDTSGGAQSASWFRLMDINLLTGEATFNSVSGVKTGAKGLKVGEWNTLEIVFKPLDGSFDLWVNDALYARCSAPVTGKNFSVGANQLIYAVDSGNNKDCYTAVADLTANYSNANYMDADNFRLEPTTGIKAEDPEPLPEGVYNAEDFEAYDEGETPIMGAGSLADNGTVAVDKDGNKFWKIPFAGSGTSKGEYNINTNGYLIHPALSYKTNPKVIFEASYYIPEDSIGVMHARFNANTCTFIDQEGNETPAKSISWLNIWQISYNAAGVNPTLSGGGNNVGATVSFPRAEWATVSAHIDMISGTYDLYLNGILAIEGIKMIPQYHNGTNWVVGSGLKNLETAANKFIVFTANSTCKATANDTWIGIDNTKVYDAEGVAITVDGVECEGYEGVLYDLSADGKVFLFADVAYADGTTETVTSPYLTAKEGMTVTTYQLSIRTQKDAGLRLNSPEGIRYVTLIDDADLEKLRYAKGVGAIEIGTLIAPQSEINLAGGVFTKAALERSLDVKATLDAWYKGLSVDGSDVFAGSIAKIKETNYNAFLSGRGYLAVTLTDGTVVTAYASNTTPASSTYALLAKEAIETGVEMSDETRASLTLVAEKYEMTDTEKQVYDLDGLNVLSIGDSLFGGHSLAAGEQWLEILAKQCNWNLTNLGVNGWTVAKNDAAYADPSKIRTSMYDKLMNDAGFRYGATNSLYYTYGTVHDKTPADVDLILLEGGWNDFGWGIPLGTVNDADGSTYMGAIRMMVAKLLEVYPNAKVVLITSWHTYDTRTKDNACRIDFVANGMKDVYATHYADNNRVGIIDAGNPILTETHMYDATWKATYAMDSAHLNAEGMKVMAESMLPLIWDVMEGYDRDGTAKDPATCEHAHATRATCATNGRCTECLSIVEPAHGHKWKSGVCIICGRRDLLAREVEKTRVVAVGDSITAGGYWKNNLGGYLPYEDYEVIGLGVSGTTGLWTGVDLGFDPSGAPYSYVTKPQYEQSKRYNGDVVVIMLGTNDTKPVNYAKITADNGAQFIADMTAMVQAYQSQGNTPQVFLALPATIYRDPAGGSMSNVNLEELIIPCLETVADATGALLIDVHGATADQSEKFPDGVHPDDAGKAAIAKTIADAILANAEDAE